MPPRTTAPRAPRYIQAPRQISKPKASVSNAPRYSSPRTLPRSVKPSSPVARSSAFNGQVTKAGSPIITTKAGKSFVIPQSGIFTDKNNFLSTSGLSSNKISIDSVKSSNIRNKYRNIALGSSGNSLKKSKKLLIISVHNKIINTPKEKRPDPDAYLPSFYIKRHIAKFRNGATKFIAGGSRYPSIYIGGATGTFVMPKYVADRAIKMAKGDPRKLEEILGLERGSLGAMPNRIDIPNPINIRVPTGRESGANESWIPGGYTSQGIEEAVIDQVSPDEYTIGKVF